MGRTRDPKRELEGNLPPFNLLIFIYCSTKTNGSFVPIDFFLKVFLQHYIHFVTTKKVMTVVVAFFFLFCSNTTKKAKVVAIVTYYLRFATTPFSYFVTMQQRKQ
jgi:hypothetical protein